LICPDLLEVKNEAFVCLPVTVDLQNKHSWVSRDTHSVWGSLDSAEGNFGHTVQVQVRSELATYNTSQGIHNFLGGAF
jgi:hypothetical protein